MKTAVISAYPCCGKSYCFEKLQHEYTMLDSDSSKFSWTKRFPTQEEAEEYGKCFEGTLLGSEYFKEKYLKEEIKVRNIEFPQNYIKHIKENLGKVDVIFVSSHLEVRQALQDAEIEYLTVYPSRNMLEEYVGRMYLRNSPTYFIKFQIENWDNFITKIESEPHGKGVRYITHDRRYLSDLLPGLVEEFRETPYGVKRVLTPRADGVS